MAGSAAPTPRSLWCYAMPLRGGRWGACQVLSVGKEHTDVVAFALVTDEPPTLKQLAKAQPLSLTHHRYKGDVERLNVRGPVPATFVPIGERKPLVDPDTPCNSYGAWTSFDLQVRMQHRWDHMVPKAEKANYRKGNREVTLGGTTKVPRHSIRINVA